jgi:hypothetical protein
LEEKQTLKKWYGMSERQFKRYVKETLAGKNACLPAGKGKAQDVSDELIRSPKKRRARAPAGTLRLADLIEATLNSWLRRWPTPA